MNVKRPHCNVPSGCIALQILALPLEHTGPYLGSSWMVLARVLDLFEPSQRHVWIDEVGIAPHESTPLMVPGHRNRASAQFLDGVISFVGVTLQDACKSVVSFLNLTDYDRFKFATGILEVEVGLIVLDGAWLIRFINLPCASSSPRRFASQLGARRPNERRMGRPFRRLPKGPSLLQPRPPREQSRISSSSPSPFRRCS